MPRTRTALLRRFWKQLTEPTKGALESTLAITRKRDQRLLLVGGAVRDLLLGSTLRDVDLVVERGALELAQAVASALNARSRAHQRFGTASVTGPGYRLDFANARREMYPHPGSLPVVEPASLEADLGRRDLTINAMAVELAGERPGHLTDLFGGERDLERGLIRVLHDESFQDDATRALRAVRYAGRFAFRIERKTAASLRRDAAYLDSISGTRLRHEFERIAVEDAVGEIISLARRYGLLEAVHPAFSATAKSRRGLNRIAEIPLGQRDAVLFCLLLSEAIPREAENAIGRLAMTNRQAEAIAGYLALRHTSQARMAPGAALEIFDPRPVASAWAGALVGDRDLARAARRYLDEWRNVKPRLNGDFLLRIGIPAGPKVGLILRKLRVARIEHLIETQKDEEDYVRNLVTSGKLYG